jgi:trans-aconitate methyltransferase
MPEDVVGWTARKLNYEPPEIDTSKAHSARLYDYLLGGKDNYPPDRKAAEEVIKATPSIVVAARQNRLFLERLTRYLAAEEGIDQFLDIGTGIPTSPNVHETAQAVNPAARVAYVDNDPIVLAHVRALLNSSPEGRVVYIQADMRDAQAVLSAPDLTSTLDLSRPVALIILSTLHFITDHDEARGLLGRYVARLAPGSFLALSVATTDKAAPAAASQALAAFGAHGLPVLTRTHAEVTALFDGLKLTDPGVVRVNRWRPDESADPEASGVGVYCGVARKP